MKFAVEHPKLKASELTEVRQLAELVGRFVEYWGFKAVQGRIWCYLFLSSRPLNSNEIAQLAKVSPALVTQSIHVLLKYQVIQAAGKGTNGILLFKANPNSATAVLNVLKAREAPLLKRIEDSANRLDSLKKPNLAALNTTFDLDPARSHLVSQWVQLAGVFLSGAMQLLEQDQNPFTHPEMVEYL